MVLDIICLLVIGIGCLIGYYKGLFKMAARLLSFIFALVIAIFCAGEIAAVTYDTLLQPTLEGFISDKVDEFGAEDTIMQVYGFVADIQTKLGKFDLNDTLSNLEDSGLGDSISSLTGTISSASDTLNGILGGTDVSSSISGALDGILGEDTAGDLKSGYNNLAQFFGKVSPSVTNFIADKIDMSEFTRVAGEAALNPENMTADKAIEALCNLVRTPIVQFITPIFFVLCFLVSSLLLTLILNLVVKLLDKVTLVDKVNHFVGLGIGAICAIPFTIAIAFLVTMFITPASDLYQYIDGSLVGKMTNSIVSHIDIGSVSTDDFDFLSNLGDELNSQLESK